MSTIMSNWFKNNPIPAFFLLTFLIAWSIWLPLGLLVPENVMLSLPGAWTPTLSALFLLWRFEGKSAVQKFVQKLFHWRVGFQWYLVVLFAIAIIACLAIGIGVLLGSPAPQISWPEGLPREAWPGVLPVIFLVNIFLGGPLAEDIGWRGYILPKLRERMTTLNASLLIGVIWAVWHLPYFFFPAWRHLVGDIPFLWFTLLTTSWSILFAWVYVHTESILMPVLFHAAINTTFGTLGMLGHSNESLTLLILNTLLTWGVAGAVIAFFGTQLKQEPEKTKPEINPSNWSAAD